MKNLLSLILLMFSVVLMAQEQPNIVVILADDMGYGEVQALNPTYGKIKTPHLDKVAQEGLVFTDGHSGSSVCTPTRYGLLTGRYAWRTRLQKGVLKGGGCLIDEQTLSLPKLLKSKGYHTAMFGKWHLGMKFDGVENTKKGAIKPGAIVSEGPIQAGFDEFYGFHYARQMDLWIENQEVTRNLEPVEMLPELTKSAVNYIASRKGNKEPFFMYIPWNAPHSPVVPSKEWQGKSGLNAHADFVMQTDDSYGQVINALKENGLWENTIVIYSADNGTSKGSSKYKELLAKGHQPSAQFRGYKADLYEGGHRVPFIVTWPKHIEEGRMNDQYVCLTDVLATAAEVVDYTLTAADGVDSYSFLNILKDTKGKTERADVIHHDFKGFFGVRKGKWKLCLKTIGKGKSGKKYQLFDMSTDESETTNVASQHPEVVNELRALLVNYIDTGRSTPGEKQLNDEGVSIVIDKVNEKKKR